MLCPICGDYLAQTILQGEARMLAHRLTRHSDPVVQAIVGTVASIGATLLFGEVWKRLN